MTSHADSVDPTVHSAVSTVLVRRDAVTRGYARLKRLKTNGVDVIVNAAQDCTAVMIS